MISDQNVDAIKVDELITLTGLKTFTSNNNKLNDYDFLKSFKSASLLSIDATRISDISFLNNFKDLVYFTAKDNYSQDATILFEVPQLMYANIENNCIEDVAEYNSYKNASIYSDTQEPSKCQ